MEQIFSRVCLITVWGVADETGDGFVLMSAPPVNDNSPLHPKVPRLLGGKGLASLGTVAMGGFWLPPSLSPEGNYTDKPHVPYFLDPQN